MLTALNDTPKRDSSVLFAPRPVTPTAKAHTAHTLPEFVHPATPVSILGVPHSTACGELTEQIACAYLGGFVARAAFLPTDAVLKTLSTMMQWAQEYENDLDSYIPDWNMHPFFYQVVQTACYAFCFLVDKIIAEPHSPNWAVDIRLPFIATSNLVPLKICPGSICDEFIIRVRAHKLFDIDKLMAENLNSVVSTRAVSTADDVVNQIDQYFPFDPLSLEASSKCIEGCYNVWHNMEAEDDAAADVQSGEEVDADGELGGIPIEPQQQRLPEENGPQPMSFVEDEITVQGKATENLASAFFNF